MQRSRAVIGLQQWLNQVAVILLKMTFHYPWAHFNCYGGDDEPGSCDEAATCKWHFILKMPNCPRRLMRGRSSPSPLAHPCSHLLVFLHPFILWFYRRARSANKAGVWRYSLRNIHKGLKEQMGEGKRRKNTPICQWNNAVEIKVLQSGGRADVWTSVFSSAERGSVPSHTKWIWFISFLLFLFSYSLLFRQFPPPSLNKTFVA